MPETAYSLRRQTLSSLLRIKRPDVPLPVVLRNTAAVILPLAVGLATGHATIGLGIAAGALNTMFSDQPGPYRKRLQRLLLATLAAGVAALAGFSLGGHLLPMLAITGIFGFVGGMLVLFGADTARVGMISMILLVVTGAYPSSLSDAVGGAALLVAGGTLLGGLSLAAWPWQRYRPERAALADVYARLASLAEQTSHGESDAPALSDAMTTLQRTLLGRHRAHGRAMEAFRVMLELAERIRLQFTAISELHAEFPARQRFAGHAATILRGIADALRHGASPLAAQDALQQLKHDLRAVTERSAAHGDLPRHLQALTGQFAAAVRNADWAGSRGEVRASVAEAALPRQLRMASALARLRANLTPRSAAFRHAVRTAVCLSVAVLLSRLLPLSHGYWLPMTAAIVLRPDFSATFSFGLLRVVGTLLGLALTTALLYVTPALPWAHLALMAVLCMGFRYLATAHYGIAVAALTGTVVILLSFEGVNSADAVMDRVINTSLGSAMALSAYLAWPTWERGVAHNTLSEMLHAYAGYLAALAGTSPQEVRDRRYEARIARTNAQASLERMRSEPGTPAAVLQLASALDANGNRLARSSMALEALLGAPSSPQIHLPLQSFIAGVAAAVESLSQTLVKDGSAPALPNLREQQLVLISDLASRGHAEDLGWIEQVCDRLVDNVDTLAHVITRRTDAKD